MIYGTAVFAFIGWLKPVSIWFWVGLLTLGAVMGFWQWRKQACDYTIVEGSINQAQGINAVKWLWIGLGSVSIIYLLSVMAPPLEGDTLHSYLDVPRRYVHVGGIVKLQFEPLASVPLNMQMLSALLLIVRGDELAQMLVGFTMIMGAAATVYLLGRRYFSIETGLWAAILFLVSHVVEFIVPTTKVQGGMAFFDLLGIYAICRWAFDEERKDFWIPIAGIFTGAGLGSHYPGGFTAGIIVLFIGIAAARQEKGAFLFRMRGALIRVMIYGLPVFILSCPWLIKSYVETGNPIYPVLSEFFIEQDFNILRYNTNPLSIVTNIWHMSTGILGKYTMSIGPMFLALLPGVLFLRPVPRKIWWALLTAGLLYLLFHYVGLQRPRHLLTAIALLAVVAAWVLVTCRTRFRIVWRSATIGFILLLIFQQVFFIHAQVFSLDKLKYIVGIVSRDQYLKAITPKYNWHTNYDLVSYINKLPRDEAIIVSIYSPNDYYFDPDVRIIPSSMTDGIAFNASLDDPQLILDEWRSLGVRYILVNTWYFDYRGWRGGYYKLVNSPEFRKNCLTLVKKSGQRYPQYLYRLTCYKLPPSFNE